MESSPSIQEIASAAIAFWDINVEEAEGQNALIAAVVRDLVEMGVASETAALAADLADKALNAHEFPDRPVEKELEEQPLYQAMVAAIRDGGYGRVGGPDE
jgi:hypothetical protein